MNASTKHTRQDSNRSIIGGIDAHLRGQTLTLGGNTYKQSQLRQIFQDDLDATDATSSAKAQWKACVVSERTTAKKTRGVKSSLLAYLVATYGPTSQVLVDFGFVPRKTAKTAPAVKAQAVQQAKLTREARGVMGKRQRAKIKAPSAGAGGASASGGGGTAKGATASASASPAPTVTTVTVTTPAAVVATPAVVGNGGNGAAVTNGGNGAAKNGQPPIAQA